MQGHRRQPRSPLHGSARGIAFVVAIGGAVLLAGYLVAAAVAWLMT